MFLATDETRIEHGWGEEKDKELLTVGALHSVFSAHPCLIRVSSVADYFLPAIR